MCCVLGGVWAQEGGVFWSNRLAHLALCLRCHARDMALGRCRKVFHECACPSKQRYEEVDGDAGHSDARGVLHEKCDA